MLSAAQLLCVLCFVSLSLSRIELERCAYAVRNGLSQIASQSEA